MITITIDEYINGFGVRVFDSKRGEYAVDEIHEERLEALKAVERYFIPELLKEYDLRKSNASLM